jgi:hypothetical protein
MRFISAARGLLVLIALTAGAACSDVAAEENMQGRIEDLETQLVRARDSAVEMQAKSAELEASLARFDDSNWREVVPDVRLKAQDVQTAAGQVVAELDQ